ncbi:RNA-binding La domain protein [Ophiocordyceps sinensis CO18]|uniref:RNA-binding La domain protein n=1 Tax=Ophiocordyceps sinensis (strain Co18 / CGMCC 3.14243) TaxID=911162 RepID=T5A6R5_OPHSC|nr:RNA-binding La domain protein [Ophiocordyceps sinensis CO18]
MSETDAATKPAEAAQPMADHNTQTAAETSQLVEAKSEPTEAELVEAKAASADETPEPVPIKTEAADEKPEAKPASADETPESVPIKTEAAEEKPEAKPASADEAPEPVPIKTEAAEEKPEAKPASADETPESVPIKTEAAEEKPEAKRASPDETPEYVPVKTEAAEEKPEAAGKKPKVAEENPEVAKADAKASEAKLEAQDDKSKMLKTTAKVDRDNVRNNRKFDPSVREVTDDPDAIRKQVEFYFGDWNFPQDKFMWETCEGIANKPMPISKIHSFKRMRSFQPFSAVVAALRNSKVLDVVGEAGEEMVKRKVAYKPMAEARVKVEASTVYVKGFGDENPDTQFDLESFFAKFGEIKGLKLRRTNEGLFKGSVFVTFPNEAAAKKFIELDPAPTYKEHELKIMSKREYCAEKSELIRQGKLEPNSSSQKKFFEGRDPSRKGARGNHRGGRDGDDWKARHAPAAANGKRARDEDGRGEGAPAAKKVDVKEEVKAEAT